MRTLYLHIGTHRTATSSVQAFMLANWDKLVSQGILHPFRIARHFALMNAIFSGRRTVKEAAIDLTRRADKQLQPVHSMVLSDEDICMRRDLSILQEFREHFNVKVIFALRRQDLWLESWFLQNIKWQWDRSMAHLTLEAFMARAEDFHWMYYDRVLSQLDGLFGQENVLPYVFEKAQMPRGPVAAFCEKVGITGLADMTPAPHVNSSYSPSIAEFVRCLPLDEAPDKFRSKLEQAVKAVDQQLSPVTGGHSSLLLDHVTRTAIMKTHEKGNVAVARRYFGRDALFSEEMPPADAPLAKMTLPSDPYELMRDYVSPMIQVLIQQYIDSLPKT
jgi:hypothetical protein